MVQWKTILNDRRLILEGPILHFHDSGRKDVTRLLEAAEFELQKIDPAAEALLFWKNKTFTMAAFVLFGHPRHESCLQDLQGITMRD